MKTAEEILYNHFGEFKLSIIKAMQEYSDQNNSDIKESFDSINQLNTNLVCKNESLEEEIYVLRAYKCWADKRISNLEKRIQNKSPRN